MFQSRPGRFLFLHRWSSRLGTIAAIALLSGVSGFAWQTPDPETAVITGRVVDATTGEPIAGAVVNYSATAERRGQMTSGSDGRFQFAGLTAGNYFVSATKAGYVMGTYGSIRPREDFTPTLPLLGAEKADVTVRMWRGGVISGTVLEKDGQPAIGLTVQVLTRDYGYWSSGGRSGTTDDRGRYRLLDINAGKYAIVVGGTGRAALPHGVFYPNSPTSMGATLVDVRSGEETAGIDFRVQTAAIGDRGHRVAGALSGGDGTIEGIEVRLLPASGTTATQDAWITRSDREGRFVFTAIPPAAYVIQAVRFPKVGAAEGFGTTVIPMGATGFGYVGGRGLTPLPPGPLPPIPPTLVGRAELEVTVGDVENVRIPLLNGGQIRGRFVFEGVKPLGPDDLQRVSTLVLPADGQQFTSIPMSQLASDGSFRTVGLPPGKYYVSVFPEAGAGSWSLVSVHTSAGDVTGSVLTLGSSDLTDVVVTFSDKTTSVVGTIRDGQNTVAMKRAIVFARDPARRALPRALGQPQWVQQAQSSPSGRYEIRWLPPGDYFIAALPGAPPDDWRAPEFLRSLEGAATAFHIDFGQTQTIDLRVAAAR